MCICFFYINKSDPSFPRFIVFFNREESIVRPSLPFSAYSENSYIVAGRDLQAQGTWLGLNIHNFNLAFLTNRSNTWHYLKTKIFNYLSRGALVNEVLNSQTPVEEKINEVY
jgi:uncharacterized protein with NRDE domain